MKLDTEIKKKIVSNWFRFLQNKICEEFKLLEKSKSNKFKDSTIKKKYWKKSKKNDEGGGEFTIMRNGNSSYSFGNFANLLEIHSLSYLTQGIH